jgi:hypothetical protein
MADSWMGDCRLARDLPELSETGVIDRSLLQLLPIGRSAGMADDRCRKILSGLWYITWTE